MKLLNFIVYIIGNLYKYIVCELPFDDDIYNP